jgi:hypothetical protein
MSISRSTFLVAVVVASAVTSAAAASDLAPAVAGKLQASGVVQGHNVKVRAKSGTVFLEGQVGDAAQKAAAEATAKSTEGVEMVVNRLTIAEKSAQGVFNSLAIPASIRSAVGLRGPSKAAADEGQADEGRAEEGRRVQLAQAVGDAPKGSGKTGPRPLGAPSARPMQPHAAQRGPISGQTVAARQPLNLPGPGAYQGAIDGAIAGGVPGGLRDGQVVPGSERYTDGGPVGAPGQGAPYAGGAPYVGGPGYAGPGGGLGTPLPARGMGVGPGAVPMRGDGPNVPNYAWPSYAASPNYAAVQYPTQYSPTAWPYIGPFYPYPQVPLGWRRVSLEWDDGWWWLDFDERHIHSHHR